MSASPQEDKKAKWEGKDHRFGINVVCEHCGKTILYELSVPIAVECTECDSTFDARLQMFKQFRREWEELTGGVVEDKS
ncbi:MAG: hypothetical protein ACREBS_07580 [Nitrososphaerales archaeon]